MNYNAHFKKKIHIFNDSVAYTHRFIMAMCVFLDIHVRFDFIFKNV